MSRISFLSLLLFMWWTGVCSYKGECCHSCPSVQNTVRRDGWPCHSYHAVQKTVQRDGSLCYSCPSVQNSTHTNVISAMNHARVVLQWISIGFQPNFDKISFHSLLHLLTNFSGHSLVAWLSTCAQEPLNVRKWDIQNDCIKVTTDACHCYRKQWWILTKFEPPIYVLFCF